MTVVVDVVALPAAVDRPQFVLSGQGSEVTIDEDHRWAAPLQAGIAETLARDLTAALDGAGVSSAPLRVQVEVFAFESRLGEDVRLEAAWIVRGESGAASSGRSRIREPAPGRDFSSLAAAHGRALSILATEIARSVRDAGRPAGQHS